MSIPAPFLPALLLAGGILPLAVGPLFARWADRSEATKGAMDAFIAISMAGIVVLHIWPHAFLIAGPWTLAGGLAGLMLPFLLHGTLHRHERKIYPGLVAVAFFGLAVHATLDGVALFTPLVQEEVEDRFVEDRPLEDRPLEDRLVEDRLVEDRLVEDRLVEDRLVEDRPLADLDAASSASAEHDHETAEGGHAHGELSPAGLSHTDHAHDGNALLALAVILHRLPMGLAIWWLAVPILGRRFAIGILAWIGVATILGFSLAEYLLVDLTLPGIAFFEATVAGMLLHVAAGHEHGHHGHGHSTVHCRHDHAPWGSALGALLGIALIIGLSHIHPVDHQVTGELTFGEAFTTLTFYIAPLLLLGILLEVGSRVWFHRDLPYITGTNRRTASLLAPMVVSFGLLGWQWTLLCAISGLGVISVLKVIGGGEVIGLDQAGGSPSQRLPDPETSRPKPWQLIEDQAHLHGAWALFGIAIVALMEPLVRFGGNSGFLSSGLAIAVAALLGILLCRSPLLTAIVSFYLLHTGWAPTAVMALLHFGLASWILRGRSRDWRVQISPPWIVPTVFLSALPLLWAAGSIPTSSVQDFHALAASDAAWWQWIAPVGLTIPLLRRLFRKGFRAFLFPVFDPAAEIVSTELSSHLQTAPATTTT